MLSLNILTIIWHVAKMLFLVCWIAYLRLRGKNCMTHFDLGWPISLIKTVFCLCFALSTYLGPCTLIANPTFLHWWDRGV